MTRYAPGSNRIQKSYFSTKAKIKITRSMTFVSFERASLVELSMHAKYEVSISYGSNVIVNVKVDNRQTDRQTERQDKNNMPRIIQPGV